VMDIQDVLSGSESQEGKRAVVQVRIYKDGGEYFVSLSHGEVKDIKYIDGAAILWANLFVCFAIPFLR